jgi:hypothetical protein
LLNVECNVRTKSELKRSSSTGQQQHSVAIGNWHPDLSESA